jgi:hypothetical protein
VSLLCERASKAIAHLRQSLLYLRMGGILGSRARFVKAESDNQAPGPALASEFEVRVRVLNLNPEEYVFSAALRRWCEENKNRCYVPEWLLKEWRITVDIDFSAAYPQSPNHQKRAPTRHFSATPWQNP